MILQGGRRAIFLRESSIISEWKIGSEFLKRPEP